uniref:AB hydrolase-1 domain-containing protein n=1 Tax=Leptocylindrus danicus TaxID=163516 RepID=A0A7S2LSQ2_9STRA|mmetsp:Transcript_8941/g.13276  ORF Transcript_8941/g.13276 Transcript_8941/m.13276 type:complete len:645 (+) Transcript_8941:138-2072(+)|eukprot:CAMPEP_0116011908 /NCGR_PEP_ID=MMETSP0321-20121206/4828_1 /TAXON_ID=163516 /ORGANISM="Leptocylindrus danicus var. danicus, Strain B650" /LENGTH=644 /DNA_ID=CAMNT_0003481191 /DNA_START=71 /DNA_END=2005 /DNA_ORIENTATION=+
MRLDSSALRFLDELGLPEQHPFVLMGDEDTDDDVQPTTFSNGNNNGIEECLFSNHGRLQQDGRQLFFGERVLKYLGVPVSQSAIPFFCEAAAATTHTTEQIQYVPNYPRNEKIVVEVESALEKLVTLLYTNVPVFLSVAQLLSRMLAPLVVLLTFGYFVIWQKNHHYHYHNQSHDQKPSRNVTLENKTTFYVVSVLGLLSSALLMVDLSYVYEFTRVPLVMLFCVMLSTIVHYSRSRKFLLTIVLPIVALATILVAGDLDLPNISDGFYFDASNNRSKAIVEEWPVENRIYSRGTPWILNGDMRTVIPWLLNSVDVLPHIRRWVPSDVPGDNEAVALDLFFPANGVYYSEKPIYIILHGLNGGSDEPFVQDFVSRQIAEGSTVAVMITRGFRNTPVVGENLPHFARTSDFEAAVRAIKRVSKDSQLIVGVGYSMGAITLANYVAKSGEICHLDVAVAISGALDTREQLSYERSKRIWQPLLARTMKNMLRKKFERKLLERLGRQRFISFIRSSNMASLDEHGMSPYHGFNSTVQYYAEMCAMGDMDLHEFNSYPSTVGRIADISIPLLTINALDDTVGAWRSLAGSDPSKLVHTGNGNLFILLTRHGGHVGWPTGWNPSYDAWQWMSNAAGSFALAVERTNKRK